MQTFINNIKTFFAVLSFVVPTSDAMAQFEERPLSASGFVSLEVFPGPPNYKCIKNGDSREKAWILTTASMGRFHLVILDDRNEKFETLRRCLGKMVRVKGVAWEAHTGHHRTPFLITVHSIEAETNKGTAVND